MKKILPLIALAFLIGCKDDSTVTVPFDPNVLYTKDKIELIVTDTVTIWELNCASYIGNNQNTIKVEFDGETNHTQLTDSTFHNLVYGAVLLISDTSQFINLPFCGGDSLHPLSPDTSFIFGNLPFVDSVNGHHLILLDVTNMPKFAVFFGIGIAYKDNYDMYYVRFRNIRITRI